MMIIVVIIVIIISEYLFVNFKTVYILTVHNLMMLTSNNA